LACVAVPAAWDRRAHAAVSTEVVAASTSWGVDVAAADVEAPRWQKRGDVANDCSCGRGAARWSATTPGLLGGRQQEPALGSECFYPSRAVAGASWEQVAKECINRGTVRSLI